MKGRNRLACGPIGVRLIRMFGWTSGFRSLAFDFHSIKRLGAATTAPKIMKKHLIYTRHNTTLSMKLLLQQAPHKPYIPPFRPLLRKAMKWSATKPASKSSRTKLRRRSSRSTYSRLRPQAQDHHRCPARRGRRRSGRGPTRRSCC